LAPQLKHRSSPWICVVETPAWFLSELNGKPGPLPGPSLLSRLKEGQAVTVYLDEAKGKVIRVLVDKTTSTTEAAPKK
jgi:hypothetical protein